MEGEGCAGLLLWQSSPLSDSDVDEYEVSGGCEIRFEAELLSALKVSAGGGVDSSGTSSNQG